MDMAVGKGLEDSEILALEALVVPGDQLVPVGLLVPEDLGPVLSGLILEGALKGAMVLKTKETLVAMGSVILVEMVVGGDAGITLTREQAEKEEDFEYIHRNIRSTFLFFFSLLPF